MTTKIILRIRCRARTYENNKKAVDLMLRSSNSIIRDLLMREVDFERNEKEDWNLPEKALTLSRESFFTRTLQVKRSPRNCWLRHKPEKILKLLNIRAMVDLISADNICGGVVAMDEQDENYRNPRSLCGTCLQRALSAVCIRILQIFRILQAMR